MNLRHCLAGAHKVDWLLLRSKSRLSVIGRLVYSPDWSSPVMELQSRINLAVDNVNCLLHRWLLFILVVNPYSSVSSFVLLLPSLYMKS